MNSLTLSCLLSVVVVVRAWNLLRFPRRRTVVTLPWHANDTNIHAYFMGLALDQARLAGDRGEVPIGAVVVRPVLDRKDRSFEVLSRGRNMVETRRDASAHAELVALRQAAQRAGNWRLANCTLYSTLEPCPMCLAASQAFRVSSVVYGAPDLRLGAIETYMNLLNTTHPFHTIDSVIPRVRQAESAALLKDFFRKLRSHHL